MPMDLSRYPNNWREISHRIRVVRAGLRCEYIHPATKQRCEAVDWQPHPITGSLTSIACCHLDHDPTNNTDSNLAAYCQLHHNRHDAAEHAAHLDRYRQLQHAEKEATQEAAGQLKFTL